MKLVLFSDSPIKQIHDLSVVDTPKRVVISGPEDRSSTDAHVSPGSRIRKMLAKAGLITTCLLLLTTIGFSQSHIGETFLIPAKYALPKPDKTLQVPDSFNICVMYENCQDLHPLLTYQIFKDSAEVALSVGNAFVYHSAINSVKEEYNDITGIWAAHFYTMGKNDCPDFNGGSNPFIVRTSIYYRKYSETFYVEYEAPCDGTLIKIGDPGLKRAIRYSYVVPKKLPRK